jgi:tetratricopeptide (TPR) repeat protein
MDNRGLPPQTSNFDCLPGRAGGTPRGLVSRGAVRATDRRYDDAMADLDHAIELDPLNDDALVFRVRVLKLQQRFAAAARAIASGQRLLPGSERLLQEADIWPDDLVLTITTLRLDGHDTRASEILSDTLVDLPPVQRTKLLFSLGDYQEVLETLDGAPTSGDADDDETVLPKVMTLRQLQRFEAASQALSEALERRPGNPHFLTERAALLFDSGNYLAALDVLNGVLADHPDHRRASDLKLAALCAQLDLGMKSVYLQNGDAAIAIFDEVLKREIDNEKALEMRALALRLQRRFDEAGAALDAALVQRPHSVRLLTERANLLFERSDYEEAAKILGDLLTIDPVNARARRMQAAISWIQENLLGGADPTPPLPSDVEPENHEAEDSPDKAKEVLEEASRLRRLRRFDEAEQMLLKARARLPEHLDLLTEQAELLFQTGHSDQLLVVLAEILKQDASNEYALRMQIMALRMQERFDEARAVLDDALAKRPVSVDLLAERGALLFDLGQYDRAIAKLDQLLERFGRSEFGFKLKALCLTRKNDIAQAQECLRLGISQSGQEDALYWELGQSLLHENKPAEALDCFCKAAAFNPTGILPLVGMAEAQRNLKLFYESETLLRSAEKRFSEDPEYLVRIAAEYIAAGNYGAARKINDCMQRDFRRNNLLDMLLLDGFLLYQDGKLNEAEAACREACSRFPNDPTAHTNLAWALAGLKSPGALAEAEALCKAVLDRNPRNVSAITCYGVIMFQRGDIHGSEHLLRSAFAYDKSSGSAVSLAGLLTYVGQYEEAGAMLDKYMERSPEDASAWLERGKLMLEQGKTSEGVRCFRRALAINPSKIDSIEALALALFRQGDFVAARRTLEDGLKRTGGLQSATLYLNLAQIHLQTADNVKEHSDYTEALKAVNLAIKSNPRLADAFFYQGLVRHRMGDGSGAIRSLQRCLALRPDHADAERDLQKLKAARIDEQIRSKGSIIGGVVIGTIMIIQLVVIWVLFFRRQLVENTVVVMTPILLGLLVIAFVLPYLIKLKFPGFEAELSRPTQKRSGSSGAGLSLDPRPPSLAIGPR